MAPTSACAENYPINVTFWREVSSIAHDPKKYDTGQINDVQFITPDPKMQKAQQDGAENNHSKSKTNPAVIICEKCGV